MLQSIREHTQGWIAGTIITIIIITFALWGIHSYFTGGINNNIVAEVNGVDITKDQFSVAYERLRRQVQTQYGPNKMLTAGDEKALKSRAFKNLAEVEVMKQASTSQGFYISNSQIDSYIENITDFQVNGRFSLNRFNELLAGNQLSTSEFVDLIRTSLAIEQPKLGMVLTSFATKDETNNTFALINQDREFDYINIPFQMFLQKPIKIAADKIKAYYEKHQAEFMTPEQVSVEYVELSLKDLASKMNDQITNQALKSFYNENINIYTEPMTWSLAVLEVPFISENQAMQLDEKTLNAKMSIAQAEAEKLRQLLIRTDIQALKNKYAPQEKWADKGFVSLNQVPIEFQKVVGELVKPQQISPVIKTKDSFVVIKALAMKPARIQTFEEVIPKVQEALARQRAEEKFLNLREQLASHVYEHPDSLEFAAKTLNLEIKNSGIFSLNKGGADISEHQKVREVAFSEDVLNLKNNSDVINITPETVIVLRAKNHQAAALLPLAQVSQQIAEKLKEEEAKNQTAEFANKIKQQLESSATPQAILDNNHLSWIKSGYLGRYSTKVDPAILDTVFRLAKPNTNKVSYGIAKLSTGFAIVALNHVKNGTAPDKQQYNIFSEQVQNSQGLLEYELYKQSELAKAKIKVEMEV